MTSKKGEWRVLRGAFATCLVLSGLVLPVLRAEAEPPTGGGGSLEFALAPDDLFPGPIARGPDGNMWFLVEKGEPGRRYDEQHRAGFIGRVTPEGQIAEFPLPAQASPHLLISGPQDSLWYLGRHTIGKVTGGGAVSEFPLPTRRPYDEEAGMAAGPDGNLWVTRREEGGPGARGAILRVTPAGQARTFYLGGGELSPREIISGRDGSLWFSATSTNSIVRITTKGRMRSYPVRGQLSYGLARGSDGSVWFDEWGAIGRVTPKGVVAEYRFAGPSGGPWDSPPSQGLYIGNGERLWLGYQRITARRIDRRGLISDKAVHFLGDPDWGPPEAADGRLWFTASGEPQCICGGSSVGAQVFTTPGSVGWVAPAPIAIGLGRVGVVDDSSKAGVELACAEEAGDGRCAGELSLSVRWEGKRLTLGHRRYELSGDTVGQFSVRLSRRAQALLRDSRAWVTVTTRLDGGWPASGGLLLGQQQPGFRRR